MTVRGLKVARCWAMILAMKKRFILSFLIGISSVFGCSVHGQVETATFEAMPIDESIELDPDMVAFLGPYREGVEAFAGEVIGYAAETLSRRRPECGLSNWAADGLKRTGEIEFDAEVEFAVSNFGGLRRDLPAGPLTRGHMLEVSPFDNYLTYLEVKGDFVVELSRQVAETGAIALSGMTVIVSSDQKVLEASVGGEMVDPSRTYKMVTIDYLVATYTDLFRPEWILEKRVLDDVIQRDAMIAMLRDLNERGLKVHDAAEGRVIFQD